MGDFGSWVGRVYLWFLIGLIIALEVAFKMAPTTTNLIVGIVLAIAMILVTSVTNNPVIEIPAFILFSVGEGLLLSYINVAYPKYHIVEALMMTSGIFVGLSVLAFAKPGVFKDGRIGAMLFAALLGVIVVEAGAVLWGKYAVFSVTNWVVIAIFIGFTLYDTAKLHDWYLDDYSSIDAAISLILDFINLFIRILAVSDRD